MQYQVAELAARVRKSKRLSLRKFAEQCGCSHTAILKIERGIFIPCDDLSVTIAALGGMAPSTFLYAAQCDRSTFGIRSRVNY